MSKYVVQVLDSLGHFNETEVEADSVKVADKTLIFFKEKKICKVISDGWWSSLDKVPGT